MSTEGIERILADMAAANHEDRRAEDAAAEDRAADERARQLDADEDAVMTRVTRKAPPREKPREEWTVADHLAHLASGAVPVSDEYRAYRERVLREQGLSDDT